MSQEKKINILEWGIILIGIAIRIYVSIHHFTHVDDIGATDFLIYRKKLGMGAVQSSIDFFTYAPLQIFFTYFAIDENYSYIYNVFAGRIISLITGIVALLLLKYLTKKLWNSNITTFLSLALLAFSWENIIYSAQMQPYEILVLFTILIGISIYQKWYESWSKTIAWLIVFILGGYAQFQFFYILFAMYVMAIFICINNVNYLKRVFVAAIINFGAVVPLLFVMYQTNMFNYTLNWNIGIGARFLYTSEKNFLSFCVGNIYLIYKYFFSIVAFDLLSTFLTILLIFLSIVGIYYIHKNRIEIAIWNDLIWIVTLIMVFNGKLALGPSRHCLFLFLPMLLLIQSGVMGIQQIVQNKNWNISVYIITFLLGLTFVIDSPNEMRKRYNYYNEEQMSKLVDDYNPDYIIGANWVSEIYNYSLKDNRYVLLENMPFAEYLVLKSVADKAQDKTRMIIYSRTDRLDDIVLSDKYIEVLDKCNINNNPNDIQILYSNEIDSGTEIEYASAFYKNFPNGLYLYVIETSY